MRIVGWDLECSSLSGMVGRILCSGFKAIIPSEYGNTKAYIFRGDDKLFFNKKNLADDAELARATRDELEKFDVVVAHNGVLFDRKFLNARLLKASERPLKPMFFVDTMWIVRTHMRTSSKLDNLQQYLGLPDEKTKITWDDWQRAMGGNKLAMNAIVEHNTQDLKVLEQAYWRLLPAMRTLGRK